MKGKRKKKAKKKTPVTSPAGRRIEFHDPTDHLEEIRKEDEKDLEKLLKSLEEED